MKTFFSFLLTLAFALPVLAQTETKDKPAIKFKSENHDFGKIKEGVQATHEFEFVNTGKGALIISNVAASCGCTTPDWTMSPSPPAKPAKSKRFTIPKAVPVSSPSK